MLWPPTLQLLDSRELAGMTHNALRVRLQRVSEGV